MHHYSKRPRTLLASTRTALLITALVIGATLCVPMGSMVSAQTSAQTSAQPSEPSGDTPAPPLELPQLEGPVLIGEVDQEINEVANAYIVRLVRQAEEDGAKTIVLRLNTFGGAVISAIAIRDALIDTDLNTVVYIDKRAISAGALISFACDVVAMTPGGTIGAAAVVAQSPAGEEPTAVDEKYVSYFREEMRSTAESNGRNPDIAEAMVDKDKEVEGISAEGKLLTLSTSNALKYGIADLEAKDLDTLLAALGLEDAERTTLESNWSERMVGFLTSPAVSGVLFLIMFVLAYLEYQTPGFGLFGFSALGCFLILYFSHYLVNLAGWEELILFLLGVVLLVVEIFVLPGFGIAGVTGMLCILASATLMLLAGDWSQFSFQNPLTQDAVQRVTISLVLGFAVFLVMMRLLPKDPATFGPGGGLLLGKKLDRGAGYTVQEAEQYARVDLAGEQGEALTPLRPAGRAQLGERRLEVQTQGEFLDAGTPIIVLRQEAGRIIVRADTSSSAASDVTGDEEVRHA